MAKDTFKTYTGTFDQYRLDNKILPVSTYHVVIMATGPDGLPSKLGFKFGDGRPFDNTPWIHDPAELENYIPKFDGDAPRNNYFLAEDGNYYEVESYGWEELEQDRQDRNLYWMTQEDRDYLDSVMYATPRILSFSTSQDRTYEINGILNGPVAFTFSLSNISNVDTLEVLASEGSWTGLGPINPANGTFTITANNISFNTAKTISVTLRLTDTRGGTHSQTISFSWVHRIHFGASSVKGGISNPTGLVNYGSIRQNNRFATINYIPSGQQYSVLFIPADIDQQGIDIRNSNAASIAHSYNMNLGAGGTVVYEQITYLGILYNVYYSFNTTNANSTAIIQ